MKFLYVLISFDAECPRDWIEEVFQEQNIRAASAEQPDDVIYCGRYTSIPGMIPRYAVELAADKAGKFLTFCQNLEGISGVYKEEYETRPKRTYRKPFAGKR